METRHELIKRIKRHPLFDIADLTDLKKLSMEDLRETLRNLNIDEAEERCIERLIEAGYDYKEIKNLSIAELQDLQKDCRGLPKSTRCADEGIYEQ